MDLPAPGAVSFRTVSLAERDVGWIPFSLCAASVAAGEAEFRDWYPKRGTGQHALAQYRRNTAKAMSICARCPVRDACGADADSRGERYGIWGGTDRDRREAAED